MAELSLARRELILGGQKSGKSRRAELLARAWLAQSRQHRACLIATAAPGDNEMRARIARHQADRRLRVPGLATVEEPKDLAPTVQALSQPDTLLVIDCLPLWLTHWLMPATGAGIAASAQAALVAQLCDAVAFAPGPLVLVSNEIGLGVIPLGREVRAFVDALGGLHQALAERCERVTLMAAGLPLCLKGSL